VQGNVRQVGRGGRVWAGDDGPGGAVPALDKRVEGPGFVAGVSDRETAGRAGARHAVKVALPPTGRVGVGTRDDRPVDAVPPLDEGDDSARVVSDGDPDGEAVGGAGTRHAIQRA